MSVSTGIRIHIFHTGRVCVSPALPGYTYGLSHSYEINEAYIRRLLVYTLGLLE